LRNDPSLFPEELIEAIKEKIELEREKEAEIASPELQSDNAGTSPSD
jgi:regulator of protease activity HflC (stomatin/prohibitin superfamily)